MVLTEFDEEKYLKMMREEERAKAVDADTLKQWTKLAARAESMQEFLTQVN